MTGPGAAVQATRLAVRRCLSSYDADTVLVACSGGADSLALLAATVFESRRVRRVVGVVVDHDLQAESADHTAHVVEQMAALGVDETASIRVRVDAGPAGVEAGARRARYAALAELAGHFGANLTLLGHTLDDQAETVLLGLTRGSGGRSITGMRRAYDGYARPFLDLTRADTEAACREQGIGFWTDPHNADPRFTRARIRHDVLPVLERELGPGVAQALARTGEMLRDDLDALDDEAAAWLAERECLPLDELSVLPRAVLTRVLRSAAVAAGSPPSDLTRAHVLALADLAAGPRGRSLDLPGGVEARRTGDRLDVSRP